MTRRQDRDAICVKRQFDAEIIVLCVRWYITYRLSDRDLVAMMAGRGIKQGSGIDFMLRPDLALPLRRRSFGGPPLASGSSSAQGHTRWPCTEPPGVATLATQAPCLAPSQSSQFKVPEQHH
jgi:hypothetical protein